MRPLIWITGLPGAGKTTLARALVDAMPPPVSLFDGDTVRDMKAKQGIKVGFSPDDRMTHAMDVAYDMRLARMAGSAAIAALVSPTNKIRAAVREILGPDMRLIYCYADQPALDARRPALYDAVRSGETEWVEYEKPMDVDMIIKTDIPHSLPRVVQKILEL